MSKEAVTLEKAISAITTAADELSPDDFIDYSVILDVHIGWSLESLSPEDQCEFLQAAMAVLESHPDLTRSIAWDLVTVLLPYLESPLPKTVEVAESLISHAANNGNPREVYIKVLQGLSSLSWVPAVDEEEEDADEEDADEEEAAFSGDEEEEAVPDRKALKEDPALAARHALRKFNNLLKALETVHPRIATKFPSRFLTTELSTLLIAFTKAVEVVDNQAATETVERLLAFVTTIRPHLLQARRQSSIERPPLPPRVSTANVTLPSDQQDADALEDKLQARLIASFLSHVLSGYLLRTRRQATAKPSSPEHEGHTHAHPSFKGSEESEERGLELGWAGKYDQEVLRPNKSKVPGGNTLIDVEREARAAQSETKVLVDEIAFMTEKLGIRTQELFELCQVGAESSSDDEDDDSDIPAPTTATEVPLSKTGALFLLANRLSSGSGEVQSFQVYPEHSAIAESVMIYGSGQSQPPVIDAIIFLGQLALDTGGLGDIPESTESFFIYLQIFSVISTNAQSAQARFLANSYVARCLRAHPNEAVRLAYVRDTLEHCPFESVKAAVVGILKDEIIHATTPVQRDGLSTPSTPNSILGTGLCLSEIFDVLFPDLEKVLEDGGWNKFKEIHPRFAATLNLYLLLLLNEDLRLRLGVTERGFGKKVEVRFLAPVRRRLEEFKEAEAEEGGTVNVQILEMTMERLDEVRGTIRED